MTEPSPHRRLDDPVRLDALRRTDLLDSPAEEAFDRYTRLLTRILGAPVSLVSLVDDDRQFFKSAAGLGEPWASARGTGLSHSFCQHVVTADAPFRVVDAQSDPRVEGNGAIADLDVIAYLGAPVHGPGGVPIGSLCAIDAAPREWTDEDLALLVELAEVTSDLIAMRTAAVERRAAVLDLSHRLRSGLTGLRLEAEEVVVDLPDGVVRGRVEQLVEGLQEQSAVLGHALRRLEQGALGSEQDVDVVAVLSAVAAEASAATSTGRPVVATSEPLGAAAALVTSATDLGRVVREVVDLLLEHGRGPVVLQVLTTDAAVRVRVQDDSSGLPSDVARAVTARSDGGGAGDASLAERVARSLGGRFLLAGSSPTTVDLVLPRRARY